MIRRHELPQWRVTMGENGPHGAECASAYATLANTPPIKFAPRQRPMANGATPGSVDELMSLSMRWDCWV